MAASLTLLAHPFAFYLYLSLLSICSFGAVFKVFINKPLLTPRDNTEHQYARFSGGKSISPHREREKENIHHPIHRCDFQTPAPTTRCSSSTMRTHTETHILIKHNKTTAHRSGASSATRSRRIVAPATPPTPPTFTHTCTALTVYTLRIVVVSLVEYNVRTNLELDSSFATLLCRAQCTHIYVST